MAFPSSASCRTCAEISGWKLKTVRAKLQTCVPHIQIFCLLEHFLLLYNKIVFVDRIKSWWSPNCWPLGNFLPTCQGPRHILGLQRCDKIHAFHLLGAGHEKVFANKDWKGHDGGGSPTNVDWNILELSFLINERWVMVWHNKKLCLYFLDQAIKGADDKVAESKNMDLTKFPPLSMKWSISGWWGETLTPKENVSNTVIPNDLFVRALLIRSVWWICLGNVPVWDLFDFLGKITS